MNEAQVIWTKKKLLEMDVYITNKGLLKMSDELGSRDNGFYELFASYDKAVLKNNLFAYAQTVADLILIGEDLYIGNEKLVKANIAANETKLLNLCKKMVKEWAIN